MAEITARLNLIPYDGSIEIKDRDGQKNIYIRKRVIGIKHDSKSSFI
jgi:hypothetical protein